MPTERQRQELRSKTKDCFREIKEDLGIKENYNISEVYHLTLLTFF